MSLMGGWEVMRDRALGVPFPHCIQRPLICLSASYSRSCTDRKYTEPLYNPHTFTDLGLNGL